MSQQQPNDDHAAADAAVLDAEQQAFEAELKTIRARGERKQALSLARWDAMTWQEKAAQLNEAFPSSGQRASTDPPESKRHRQRKPSPVTEVKRARKAGFPVKSYTVGDVTVNLAEPDDTTATTTNNTANPWDEVLKH
jgi:hypothetical protein